jgi:hypothetical protein
LEIFDRGTLVAVPIAVAVLDLRSDQHLFPRPMTAKPYLRPLVAIASLYFLCGFSPEALAQRARGKITKSSAAKTAPSSKVRAKAKAKAKRPYKPRKLAPGKRLKLSLLAKSRSRDSKGRFQSSTPHMARTITKPVTMTAWASTLHGKGKATINYNPKTGSLVVTVEGNIPSHSRFGEKTLYTHSSAQPKGDFPSTVKIDGALTRNRDANNPTFTFTGTVPKGTKLNRRELGGALNMMGVNSATLGDARGRWDRRLRID